LGALLMLRSGFEYVCSVRAGLARLPGLMVDQGTRRPLFSSAGGVAILQLTLESHTDETLFKFGRALATIPEVLEAYLVSGDYDYYIRIAVRDTRDYERLAAREALQDPRHPAQQVAFRTASAEGVDRARHVVALLRGLGGQGDTASGSAQSGSSNP
jgi:DNA-binding Lrp family transcriptional regulator